MKRRLLSLALALILMLAAVSGAASWGPGNDVVIVGHRLHMAAE